MVFGKFFERYSSKADKVFYQHKIAVAIHALKFRMTFGQVSCYILGIVFQLSVDYPHTPFPSSNSKETVCSRRSELE